MVKCPPIRQPGSDWLRMVTFLVNAETCTQNQQHKHCAEKLIVLITRFPMVNELDIAPASIVH